MEVDHLADVCHGKVHSEHIDDAPFVNPMRVTARVAGHDLNVTA